MIKSLGVMIQFFTRLPLNIKLSFDRDTISRGTLFLPLIGMIIGSISALIYYILSYVNSDIASLGAVFAIIAVTGGLHVDGLSDTADGFFSSRSRERILEIMKDSRVGSFGAIAILFDILSKYVIIKSLSSKVAVETIILSCGIARMSVAMLFTFGRSARKEGLGNLFTGNNTKVYFFIGSILFIASGYLISGGAFFAAASCTLLFAVLLMKLSYRVIGGLTGDVYGAACELGEILSMFVFLVVRIWI